MIFYSTCGNLKATYHSPGGTGFHYIKVKYLHMPGGFITLVSEAELYYGSRWKRS